MTTTTETRYDENNYWTEDYDVNGVHTGGTIHYEEILSNSSKTSTVIPNLIKTSTLTETHGIDTAEYTIAKGVEVPADAQYHSSVCEPDVNSWSVRKIIFNMGGTATHYVAVHAGGNLITTKPMNSLADAEAATELTDSDGTVYRKGAYHSNHLIFANDKYYALEGAGGVVKEKRFQIIFEIIDSPIITSPTPIPKASLTQEELNTAKIKNGMLSIKIAKSPTTIQSLRQNIILNTIQFAKELQKHRFHEIGEIVRVCTALGVRRAFLRGLPHNVTSEENIDQFIYRFDLKGALPFVDSTTKEIIPGKIFFKPTKNIMLFFCMSNDYKAFLSLTNNVANFVIDGSIDTNQIQTEFVDQQKLPDFVMIPKYAKESTINGNTYSDDENALYDICDILRNRFPSESVNCVTTIKIYEDTVEKPQPNRLVPINVNPFPYLSPNPGLPFGKTVLPEPIRIRMVIDGIPLDNEQLILANRFELSGTVRIQPGENIIVNLTPDDVNNITNIETDPPIEDPGTIVIPIGEFPNVPQVDGIFEYAGPGMFILDPVEGTGTKFEQELFVNDVIELQKDGRMISGKFFTNGGDYVYYAGQEFIQKFNNTNGNIRIKLTDILYTLGEHTENQSELGQSFELKDIDQTLEYNARYKIISKETTSKQNQKLSSKTFSVSFERDVLNPYKGDFVFDKTSLESQNLKLSDIFENGEGIIASSINDGEGNVVQNVNFSFGKISDENCKLENCFVYFPENSTYRMTVANTPSLTITRGAKNSLHMSDFAGAFYLPTYTYHRVQSIDSNTKIEITPPATDVYEGKVNRIGFCAYSQSSSPSLRKQGLDTNCTVTIQPAGSNFASDQFFMPAARTDKVVLYQPNEITANPSAQAAIAKLGMTTYNHSGFDLELGKELEDTEIHFETFNHTILGTLIFKQEGLGDFISIETIDDDQKPISHGFNEDDILKLYKRKHQLTAEDDPYGELINGNTAIGEGYSSCGVHLQVIEVISPYRFLVDKTEHLSAYLETYKEHATEHIRATNGSSREFWSKYFQPVYFDGTVDYSGTRAALSETIVLQKKHRDSNTMANYFHTALEIQSVKTGITPVKIISDASGMGGYTITSTANNADAFIFAVEDELRTPPQLLDMFPLRSAKFYKE